MPRPPVASREEWLAARRALLAREKEATRLRDAIAEERRALPMVRVDAPYVFETPDGPATLRDLFGGRTQLVVYHFMFAPTWAQGCRSCSYVMDNVEGALAHLGAADTAFVAVSRAPLAQLEAFKARMGWRFPWVSSGESDFNYDYHVTLDEARGSGEYNYEPVAALRARGEVPPDETDMPGFSVFLRDGDEVFHTYSTYLRGVDAVLNTYTLLDMTPLGRNEAHPMQWVRHRDRYPAAGVTA
ncbi:DUF899 domain-containing protein [Roseisolibacter sp. H3M3-2]|uniref:DUF899 domain-containing protein n=1 Tax=Roseisolibacter sp. H3M3-2 TaxID=3031323 RepID=UPI0023DB5189|nr:DUF899 domain-containing protein [Roseisolibacter sp. H3M3-2]MDF1504217.1 DUF899 domain-containing protein [Roseisolibacter sp. H3M3-2]